MLPMRRTSLVFCVFASVSDKRFGIDNVDVKVFIMISEVSKSDHSTRDVHALPVSSIRYVKPHTLSSEVAGALSLFFFRTFFIYRLHSSFSISPVACARIIFFKLFSRHL
jgi:hypothetical protein